LQKWKKRKNNKENQKIFSADKKNNESRNSGSYALFTQE
jgi:hypothetical protein